MPVAAGGAADLAARLQERCVALGLKVGTAESCTGGLVAKLLTDLAGSSEYFAGGIVSYSNEVKAALLGVDENLIRAHGAVSAQVACAMARGARERLGVDMALSVTGVAGPGGATPGKPVGLTYVGVADANGVDVRRFVWNGDRAANREASAVAALEMALERVEALAGGGRGARPGGAGETDTCDEAGTAEEAGPARQAAPATQPTPSSRADGSA